MDEQEGNTTQYLKGLGRGDSSYQSSAWLGLGVFSTLLFCLSLHMFFPSFLKMTAVGGKRGRNGSTSLFSFVPLALLRKVCSMYGVFFFFSSENSWEVYYAHEMSLMKAHFRTFGRLRGSSFEKNGA
ncbi:hypothetical protein J3F84DRAFT_382736 [Trichoderma pleuroticola]